MLTLALIDQCAVTMPPYHFVSYDPFKPLLFKDKAAGAAAGAVAGAEGERGGGGGGGGTPGAGGGGGVGTPGAGPGRYCSCPPRQPKHVYPSFLDLEFHGIL